tara:strand:- start:2171 stop:2605 length:435 start_codon:yes stop_codon:yes gene_type:complete
MARIQIQILIDDSCRLNPQDAGGMIVVRQGESEARTDYLLVDYWLMQLIDGLNQGKKKALGLLGDGNSETWIDFAEDRTSVKIHLAGPMVLIEMGEASFKTNIAELEIELRKAAKEFVENYRGGENYDVIPSFRVIENFVTGET